METHISLFKSLFKCNEMKLLKE